MAVFFHAVRSRVQSTLLLHTLQEKKRNRKGNKEKSSVASKASALRNAASLRKSAWIVC